MTNVDIKLNILILSFTIVNYTILTFGCQVIEIKIHCSFRNDGKQWKCEICCNDFSSKEFLEVHIQVMKSPINDLLEKNIKKMKNTVKDIKEDILDLINVNFVTRDLLKAII